MRSLKNFGRKLTVGASMLALVFSTADLAVAQSTYLKQFKALYGDHYKNSPDVKLTCAVCHPTKSKKERNNWGATLGKELGAKKVKGTAKIDAALKAASEKDSATSGKKFIDLIKDGKLPGTKDVAK